MIAGPTPFTLERNSSQRFSVVVVPQIKLALSLHFDIPIFQAVVPVLVNGFPLVVNGK